MSCGDVQTAAMLGCAFSEKLDPYAELIAGLKSNAMSSSPPGQIKGSVRRVIVSSTTYLLLAYHFTVL